MRENLPIRKNIRLQGYDYSQAGYYFVTICVKDKHELLWENVGANSVRPPLSDAGKIVEYAINQIPIHFRMVSIDKYVVMPNHIHMILKINNIVNVDESGRTLFAPTVSRIIKQCKEYVTKQIGIHYGKNPTTTILYAMKRNIKKYGGT